MNRPNDYLNDDNELFSDSSRVRRGGDISGGVFSSVEKRPVDYDDVDFDNQTSESVLPDGEKSEVERDERTVRDDADDYLFLKRRKKKHSASAGVYGEADEEQEEESPEDFVYSNKRSNHGRHSGSRHGSSHRRKKKKMKKWKKVLLIIGIVLLSLILIIAGTGAFLIYQGQKALYTEDNTVVIPENIEAQVEDDGDYITYNGKKYEYNKNITNLLFVGVDKSEGIDSVTETGTNGQGDVIVLMAIDTKAGKCTMINLPRDTVTDVAIYSEGVYVGMEKQQICLAYAYGKDNTASCENTIAAVKRIFYNVPVNTYFALNLDGIAAMNDAVGGVDVVSPETIGEFVEGESYHLEGKTAEDFVHTRSMDQVDANLKRNKRQQVYVKSYMNKVIAATKKDITTPVNLFNASAPYSCTNMDVSRISYLAKELVTGRGMQFDIQNVEGKMTLNEEEQHAEFSIDETKFFEQFLSVFYTEK